MCYCCCHHHADHCNDNVVYMDQCCSCPVHQFIEKVQTLIDFANCMIGASPPSCTGPRSCAHCERADARTACCGATPDAGTMHRMHRRLSAIVGQVCALVQSQLAAVSSSSCDRPTSSSSSSSSSASSSQSACLFPTYCRCAVGQAAGAAAAAARDECSPSCAAAAAAGTCPEQDSPAGECAVPRQDDDSSKLGDEDVPAIDGSRQPYKLRKSKSCGNLASAGKPGEPSSSQTDADEPPAAAAAPITEICNDWYCKLRIPNEPSAAPAISSSTNTSARTGQSARSSNKTAAKSARSNGRRAKRS